MAKEMSIKVHTSKEGMAVVFNKHALAAIKEGRVGQVNLTSGKGTMVLQMMRDSTFKQMKLKEQRAMQAGQDAAKALLGDTEQPVEG